MNVSLIVATTIDGYIAQSKDQSSLDWTSKEDKKFFAQKTKEIGTLIMGLTTYNTIGKALPEREIIVYSDDTSIETPGVRATTLSPKELLTQLESEGISDVVISGGASIYSLFMKEGLVDTLYVTKEPVVFGSGIPFLQEDALTQFTLTSHTGTENGTLFLTYTKNGNTH
jgi:dihydrofolate reductase